MMFAMVLVQARAIAHAGTRYEVSVKLGNLAKIEISRPK